MSFWRIFVIFFISYSTVLFLFIKIEIDGNSMLPTIEDKSFVFAKKNYPFLSKVNRGDIISFSVEGEDTDFIKRVLGMPGDTVLLKNGQLIINNKAIPKVGTSEMNEFTETLNNGKSYNVLDTEVSDMYDNTKKYLVPAKHYFVLGDNRDNSNDSRSIGFVHYKDIKEKIISETEFIYYLKYLFFWLIKFNSFKIKPTKNKPKEKNLLKG